MKIPGSVVSGKFKPDNPAALPIAFREYDGKRVTVEIEPEKTRRSTQANARYWTCLVPLAQHCLNLKRPGLLPLSKDQVHAVLVSAFVGQEETELGPVPVRTRTMTKEQFHAFNEQVERWLAENQYLIPDSLDAAELIEEATS
jgi:hypothetical protein